jgi:hypothetical protein
MPPPDIAAASVLLVYAAMPVLPPSVTLGDLFKPSVEQWLPADAAALPALYAAAAHMEAICALRANWDGYGGLPIHPETARHAKSALRVFQQLPVGPDITPNPNGTISFEWSSPRGEAHIEMGKTRYVGIVRPKGSGDIQLSGETATLAEHDLKSIAATIKAALFPSQSTPLTSSLYAAAHVRSAA